MAGAQCAKTIRGVMARFTKVDRCGAVVPGPLNSVVTTGLITVTYTPTNDAGTTITVVDGTGTTVVNDIPTPKFQYISGSIALIGVNPLLIPLLTNQETWAGADEDVATGFTIGDDIDPDEYGFAVELWSGINGNLCEDGSRTWGYFLVPWFKAGGIGAVTPFANDAINFTVENVISQSFNDWGVGPWDVTRDEDDLPSPLLRALGERKHFLFDQVTLAPPVEECGAQPVGTEATGATAGTPGALTPSGSYAQTLADLTGVTASPNTAWVSGQYIVLGDGSLANWNGTAWEAGPA